MGALNDEDPEIRRAAAYALGQMDYLPAISGLLKRLVDPALWVRDAAARSLAVLGEDDIVPISMEMAHQTS